MSNSENALELTLSQTLQVEVTKRSVKERIETILKTGNLEKQEELINVLCEDVANLVRLDLARMNFFKKNLKY